MRQISDTDVGFAYNGSPFIDKNNLRKMIKQYESGKTVTELADYWEVTPATINYRLKQAGIICVGKTKLIHLQHQAKVI